MTIRSYSPEDREALEEMARQSGFPYPRLDSPMIEECLVVEDENGNLIAALAAKRIVELYLFKSESLRPALFMSILRQMRTQMGQELKRRGYVTAEAALPPGICERFGRRLERSLGFVRNWPSWGVKL